MGDISHAELLGVVLTFLALVTGGLGWYVRSIKTDFDGNTSKFFDEVNRIMRDDHVHRAEFIALQGTVTTLLAAQASLQAQLSDTQRLLERAAHQGGGK